MLHIFRTIRQRLLSENRFTRYLIYALGEIVLVVAGILIALQINNWSEEAKERTLDQTYLLVLKEDLLNYHTYAQSQFSVMIRRYADIIEAASRNIYNTRFNILWDPESMVPHDFEALKRDKEYYYFLSSQEHQLY